MDRRRAFACFRSEPCLQKLNLFANFTHLLLRNICSVALVHEKCDTHTISEENLKNEF